MLLKNQLPKRQFLDEKEVMEVVERGKYDISSREPVTVARTEWFCEEFKEVPHADILVEIFLEQADPETLRIGEEFGVKEVLAEVGGVSFLVSLKLEKRDDRVALEVYDNTMDLIPQAHSHVGISKLVHISTEERRIVTRDVEHEHGLNVSLKQDIFFPSERNQWILGIIYDLAQKTNKG